MDDPWQILRDGGLPLAITPSGARRSHVALAGAIHAALATNPTGREADALAAYIGAWASHWPTSFAQVGPNALAWARDPSRDRNRYLKLRRIAIENLASVVFSGHAMPPADSPRGVQ